MKMNKMTKQVLKKNNLREEAILDENQEVYTNMIVYLRGSNITEYNQELVREDIIDLILDGQQRGDNIQKVMGGRYKEVCDDIIDAMPKKTTKEKIIDFVGMSLGALWILVVIAIIKNLITGFISDTPDFSFILSVGDIINIFVIILIANVTVWFVSRTAFSIRKGKKIISFLKIWLIASVLFSILILNSLYLTTIAVKTSLVLAAIFVLVIYFINRVVDGRTWS